jgi:glucan phosphoethanolaminetransferase (alkaline phosphatase superfamily)
MSFYPQNKTNVIIIVADSLRPDHLTFYGYDKKTSPFLERLANNSLVFRNCIAQSASTIFSILSLLTSKYPFKDGLIGYKEGLPYFKEGYISLPELLKKHGYKTIGIVSIEWLKEEFGFGKGFDYYDDNFVIRRNAEETTLIAIKQLKKTKGPFFLFIHYIEPHLLPEWYNFEKEYYQAFLESCEINEWGYIIYGEFRNISNCQLNELKAKYDRQILYLDSNLKVLFDYLNSSGLLNQTIIIFTSDHAELLGEHKVYDHNNLYYRTLRVPLILSYLGVKRKIIGYIIF